MIVGLIRAFFGLLAAALTAGVVQVLFVAGDELVAGAVSSARLEALGLLVLLAATQSAVFSLPLAVPAIVFAAWQQIRSPVFFAAAGTLVGLAGFLVQYVAEAGPGTILNRYALAAYATSGLAGGLAYWLAGVAKGRRTQAAA